MCAHLIDLEHNLLLSVYTKDLLRMFRVTFSPVDVPFSVHIEVRGRAFGPSVLDGAGSPWGLGQLQEGFGGVQ